MKCAPQVCLWRKNTKQKRNETYSCGEACQIFINGHWGGCSWDTVNAASWHNDFDEVTGYCCASYGSGDFSNAGSCNAQ